MEATVSPQHLARVAITRLQAVADPGTGCRAKSYFKPHERVFFLGVSGPKLRKIVKELHSEVRGKWTLAEAMSFADILVHEEVHEARVVGLLLLARSHTVFEQALLDPLHAWLSGGLCDNWALTDALSIELLAPLLRKFPELMAEMHSWTQSANLWVRRAAAVSVVPFARKGEHLDAAYGIAEALLGDAEDLIHKATGWLLREAGKTDPARLERFLLAHGPDMPRTTLRYAIERFPEEKRKMLLVLTRRS